MKKHILAIYLLAMFYGCHTQYEYAMGVDHAAEQIDSWGLPSRPNYGASLSVNRSAISFAKDTA